MLAGNLQFQPPNFTCDFSIRSRNIVRPDESLFLVRFRQENAELLAAIAQRRPAADARFEHPRAIWR